MVDKIVTPEARLSYPNLFKARSVNGNEPKYSCTLIFGAKADLSKLKTAALEAAREKWGSKADDMIKRKQLKLPFRDGAEKDGEGYGEGTIFVNATSKQKPGLVDRGLEPIIEDGDLYPGCYVRASLRAFAYDTQGNKGVSFGLQNVQKLRDGDPIGGRSRPADDFEPIEAGSDGDADLDDILGTAA